MIFYLDIHVLSCDSDHYSNLSTQILLIIRKSCSHMTLLLPYCCETCGYLSIRIPLCYVASCVFNRYCWFTLYIPYSIYHFWVNNTKLKNDWKTRFSKLTKELIQQNKHIYQTRTHTQLVSICLICCACHTVVSLHITFKWALWEWVPATTLLKQYFIGNGYLTLW